jgi:hypothetical protein
MALYTTWIVTVVTLETVEVLMLKVALVARGGI